MQCAIDLQVTLHVALLVILLTGEVIVAPLVIRLTGDIDLHIQIVVGAVLTLLIDSKDPTQHTTVGADPIRLMIGTGPIIDHL